jgi:tRNA-splicing ligase RtcB
MDTTTLNKIHDHLWEIPQKKPMRVPGRIFASELLVRAMDEKVREQVMNVAALPGIQVASFAMPDAHWGYGFPIGGVAAFDPDEDGVLSVGGVGFDISCGVRTIKTGLTLEQVRPRLQQLADGLFNGIPAGVGSEGLINLTHGQIDEMLAGGARWAVKRGYGSEEDLAYIEEQAETAGGSNSPIRHCDQRP